MKTRRNFLIVLIAVSVVSVAGSALVTRQRSYGSATVKRFIAVDGPFTFRCDIDGFPDIIGKDMPVCISDLAPPQSVGSTRRPNLFYEKQLAKHIEDALGKAEKIELRNIRRGSGFNLLADVYADNQNLALTLVRDGLAQHKPEEKPVPPSAPEKPRTPEKQAQKEGAQDKTTQTAAATAPSEKAPFIASKTSKIFHKSTCRSVQRITEENSVGFQTRQQAIDSGRRPCKTCSP